MQNDNIVFGVTAPWDKDRPFKKQHEFLYLASQRKKINDAHVQKCIDEGGSKFDDHRPVQYLHYVGGRGSSKTTTDIIDMYTVAMVDAPGFRTFWSARTNGEIQSVLLRELEKVIPKCYKIWKVKGEVGARYIEWASGHTTDLVSRSIYNSNKRPALGGNYMGGWHDEAATGFDQSKFDDIDNAGRAPNAPYLFIVSTSTPLPNGYYNYVINSEGPIVYSSSWDNPHLSKEFLKKRVAMMDPLMVQQEIEGKFIQTTGRQWETFIEKPWPEGNILEGYEFDYTNDFYVNADLGGAQSAYQIWQYVDPIHPVTGRLMFQGKLAVVVAEMTPNNMGIEACTAEIIKYYCNGDHIGNKPLQFNVGHDIANPGNTVPASNHLIGLGWNWRTPKGIFMSKDIQRVALRSLIYNTAGDRRIVVAANKDKNGTYQINKQHFGERKTRGILNMFRNDTFPDPKSTELFNKDKSKYGKNAVEDDRDCTMYGAVILHPPYWGMKEVREH